MLKDQIKKARVANGYTQEDVAAVLGIERSTYAYYETGKTDISVKALVMLAKVFNVPIGWLLAEDDEQTVRPKRPSSLTLNSPNIFMPETFPDNYRVQEEETSDTVRLSSLTSDERVFLARYRVIREMHKTEEINELMKKLLSEKAEKI